mmetsp:Transcript_15608/g.18812  ORF Transcript_15608/g.18812 Transcript_15608/m.18812 type:complete len:365 (+) Transcript_15608:315-1409(+)
MSVAGVLTTNAVQTQNLLNVHRPGPTRLRSLGARKSCCPKPAFSVGRATLASRVWAPRPVQGAPRLRPCASSNNDDAETADSNNDDDEPPELTGDWRDFRARLVMSQYASAGKTLNNDRQEGEQEVDETGGGEEDLEEEGGGVSEEDMDKVAPTEEAEDTQARFEEEMRTRVEMASEENMELLRKENPELAGSLPWAHPIPSPEKGCLIIAQETMFHANQAYFCQAVILLLEHNEQGSTGVILNRPVASSTFGEVAADPGPFTMNPLYFGGDVRDNTVCCVHGHGDLEGAELVRDGVYYGGIEAAVEQCSKGDKDPMTFKFFAGYAGWGPGQLEQECARGVWYFLFSPYSASSKGRNWFQYLTI